MEIFIGNWPARANTFDLRKLFDRPLQTGSVHQVLSRLLGRKAVTEERFRVMAHQGDRGVQHYGYAVIEPDDVARALIARLNHTVFRGERLVVREYVARAYINDRRALDWRSRPWSGPERRSTDRRRPILRAESAA